MPTRGTEPGAIPERCLSFTVEGTWGHFRRVEGNVIIQTYRIIPRTTAAGLIAAILGIGRDEYYDLFSLSNAAMAIEPTEELRTMNIPVNVLSTDESSFQNTQSNKGPSVKLPDPSLERQQHTYEVLRHPAYRIDLALSDEDQYEELRTRLEDGTSYYTPTLGLSEYIASITYHGEFEPIAADTDGRLKVDSAVPGGMRNAVISPDTTVTTEKSPAAMALDSGGRKPVEFTAYAYNKDASPVAAEDVTAATVDGRTVMFV
jgi:CRISPR-associated protein Cas5h